LCVCHLSSNTRKHGHSIAWVDARERPSEIVGHTRLNTTVWLLSWKESRVLRELRCNLDDVGRCALTRTFTLSAKLIVWGSLARLYPRSYSGRGHG
jgi:hypothetical protein